CLKYDVLILADEIHGDLVFPEYQHIPIASLSRDISKQTVTFMSPSKSFNLAGLQASYIITENVAQRRRLNEQIQKVGFNTLNTMGNIALEAAYTYGESWLDTLLTVLKSHKDYVTKMFNEYTKSITVVQ